MVDPEAARGHRRANKAGLRPPCAIGDRANDWLLDAFEKIEQGGPKKDWRFRTEHAQHLTPAAIKRFGPLVWSPPCSRRTPSTMVAGRRSASVPNGSGNVRVSPLIDSGAHLIWFDWPVAALDPLTGIYAAVTRRTNDGANPNGGSPSRRSRSPKHCAHTPPRTPGRAFRKARSVC